MLKGGLRASYEPRDIPDDGAVRRVRITTEGDCECVF